MALKRKTRRSTRRTPYRISLGTTPLPDVSKKIFSDVGPEDYQYYNLLAKHFPRALLSALTPSSCRTVEWSRYRRLIVYRQLLLMLWTELEQLGFSNDFKERLSLPDTTSQSILTHWYDSRESGGPRLGRWRGGSKDAT